VSKARKIKERAFEFFHLNDLSPKARRIVIGIVGTTVAVIGVALIFLPGPAFIVIPAGLAILATEFVWARRWLNKLRQLVGKMKSKKDKRN
jgi:tellurite resistance protein TerC